MAVTPYKYVKRPNHPLRPPGGSKLLPEHRVILYDKIGPGTHPCHWCSKPVTWIAGGRTRPGSLVTDHVNKIQQDNRPENLVPSCQGCNIRRGKGTHLDTEPIVIYQGKRAAATERVCRTCGT